MESSSEIQENNYPSLVTRIQSIAIDTVLIFTAMFLIGGLFSFIEGIPDWIRAALFIGLLGIYEPLFMTFGGTLGNRLMKITIRQKSSPKEKINIRQSYIRFVVKIMLGWLSFISIHMNKEKRAIHDLASGTVMTNNYKD